MKFSLILCTIHRTQEVEDFLNSLKNQTYNDYEVIIVDQNKDKRLNDIIALFYDLNIIHITSNPGLSKARNIGLKITNGDIVCFPDDDCTYPHDLLQNVFHFFNTNGYAILMGKTIDYHTKKVVAGKNVITPQKLKPSFILGSSTTLFIRKNKDISFDERFGIGGVFNAEEENDLLFRLLKKGYTGYYEPNINYVYHPPSDLNYTDIQRSKNRAIGLGAFIAKHLFSFEGIMYFIRYNMFRPILGSFIHLIKFDTIKSKFYFYRFLGIWIGFLKYFKVNK